MFNFDILKEAKKKSLDESDFFEKAESSYEEALKYIRNFQQTKIKKELELAAEKLFEVIKYKRKQAKAYIWLSYIFIILDDSKMAIKYLKIAEIFEPDFPKINELKILIEKTFSLSTSCEKGPVSELVGKIHTNAQVDPKKHSQLRAFFNRNKSA